MEDNKYGIWTERKDGLMNGHFFMGNWTYPKKVALSYVEEWDNEYPHLKHEIRKVKSL